MQSQFSHEILQIKKTVHSDNERKSLWGITQLLFLQSCISELNLAKKNVLLLYYNTII